MSKTFRSWDVDQRWLLPPSVQEMVPEGHLAHFIRDTVREELDLSSILSSYDEERGYPPYHPTMMTALLLYAYSRGVYSSRQIARACEERVDFMAVTAINRPDFRTIAAFRQRHIEALKGLFDQVLQLCRAAGLVKLGHVALDGTKMKANASKHKAMSYGRMRVAETQLRDEIAAWFSKAQSSDADEDRIHGAERRGDELPDWVANKQARLERIKKAKADLEAEARRPPPDERNGPGPSSGMTDRRGPCRGEDGAPPDRAQRNFTDPDSRIQQTNQGFIQGYNAQIAVDAAHQIIVAQRLQTNASDRNALKPLVEVTRKSCGTYPQEVSADAGFCSEDNLAFLAGRKISGYIALVRARHRDKHAAGRQRWKRGSHMAAMAVKLKRGGRRSRYRLRKMLPEPVFGQIKHARAFRQFLLRGFEKVAGEWAILCTVHNLHKLARAR